MQLVPRSQLALHESSHELLLPCYMISRPSHRHDSSAVVSDAAWGGQTLMCSETFRAVKEMGRELGRVTKDGLSRGKGDWSFFSAWWR